MHLRWIYKGRVGVIGLYYKPWMLDRNFNCSLLESCNLNEIIEDAFHYIAKCPILTTKSAGLVNIF